MIENWLEKGVDFRTKQGTDLTEMEHSLAKQAKEMKRKVTFPTQAKLCWPDR